MCTVYDKQRLPVDDRKATVPFCVFQTFLSLFDRCRIALFIQNIQSLDCQCCILCLIGTGQGQLVSFTLIFQYLTGKILFHCFCCFKVCNSQICTFFSTHFLYDFQSLRPLSDSCHRTAGFNNSGFFLCNLGKCISKKALMVHTDRNQNGKYCIFYNIGCIQISAHADFQNYQITVFFCKK